MSVKPEPFTISYCGVSTEVTPLAQNSDMQYLIILPTRTVIIETKENENEISYWVETNGQRTLVAEEIGALIESHFI